METNTKPRSRVAEYKSAHRTRESMRAEIEQRAAKIVLLHDEHGMSFAAIGRRFGIRDAGVWYRRFKAGMITNSHKKEPHTPADRPEVSA